MRKKILGTDLEVSAVGFVAFSPLANGFLSGKYNVQSVFEKNTDYRLIMPQFQKDSYVKNQEFLA
jgi:aryl-alcohol dehydrogenase-like predicted oxidoreductase